MGKIKILTSYVLRYSNVVERVEKPEAFSVKRSIASVTVISKNVIYDINGRNYKW